MLDLPTAPAAALSLAATGPVLSAADGTAALAATGTGDALTAALPASLLSLTGVSVAGYRLGFSAVGDQPTTTTVSLAFGAARPPGGAAAPGHLRPDPRRDGGAIPAARDRSAGSPRDAALAGTLDFAGIHLPLSTMPGAAQAPTVPAVLGGALTPADAASVQV